jgi:hypothetical protein
MPSTRKFGTKITLDHKTQRATKQRRDVLFDKLWHRIFTTLSNPAGANGERLVKPTILFSIEPTCLLVDLKCELIDGWEGLQWFTNSFNGPAFRDGVNRGLTASLSFWGQEVYTKAIVVTESGEVKQMKAFQ